MSRSWVAMSFLDKVAAIRDAMRASFGTVALIDRTGVFFKRICCLYELQLALERNQSVRSRYGPNCILANRPNDAPMTP